MLLKGRWYFGGIRKIKKKLKENLLIKNRIFVLINLI